MNQVDRRAGNPTAPPGHERSGLVIAPMLALLPAPAGASKIGAMLLPLTSARRPLLTLSLLAMRAALSTPTGADGSLGVDTRVAPESVGIEPTCGAALPWLPVVPRT